MLNLWEWDVTIQYQRWLSPETTTFDVVSMVSIQDLQSLLPHLFIVTCGGRYNTVTSHSQVAITLSQDWTNDNV